MKPQKIGILGGGQLGKMLCQAASSWDLKIHVLDESADFPAAKVCHSFVEGNFKNYDDVMRFGAAMDIVTIEIENVNIEALFDLQKSGVVVHPSPQALHVIKDKGLQKDFFVAHKLPTVSYQLFDNLEALHIAIQQGKVKIPFVQKARTGGYDGKGVHVVRSEADILQLLDTACVVEPLVNIEKEIAVIAARNASGEITTFPAVEMAFHPTANLVEFLHSPTNLVGADEAAAMALAHHTISCFDMCGLLAVEMFLTTEGELLINEVAPRPHNSGHHTIEGCYTSQFQQHLRAILNMPLGSTNMRQAAVMINLLGEDGYSGAVHYEGVDDCLSIEGCYVHLYGKETTKPFRKMGHITCVDNSLSKAIAKARRAQKMLRVISQ